MVKRTDIFVAYSHAISRVLLRLDLVQLAID